jgi:putative phosphoribosyl transferase
MNRVINKTALITGGALGIGRATCLLLAREGARVVITDVRDTEGRALAEEIAHGRPDVVVLGLPRGGVPVAHAVARSLDLPMDILIVRKLGVPGQEEVAFGAIAGDGVQVLNPAIVAACGLDGETIGRVVAREQRELARRELVYRDGRPSLRAKNRTVILVDDGIATGATVRAALALLQKLGAGRVVVAAPVIACEARAELDRAADEVVAVCVPADFHGVGEWYDDFSQTTDAEVLALLESARPPALDRQRP